MPYGMYCCTVTEHSVAREALPDSTFPQKHRSSPTRQPAHECNATCDRHVV